MCGTLQERLVSSACQGCLSYGVEGWESDWIVAQLGLIRTGSDTAYEPQNFAEARRDAVLRSRNCNSCLPS